MTLYALDGIAPELPEDEDCWIAPDANVIGNVRIGSGSSIWFGSTLRGDNERIDLGRRVNIQENCVLHTDPGYPTVVGNWVTTGHNVVLHGCRVGDTATIGMGATVLNARVLGSISPASSIEA